MNVLITMNKIHKRKFDCIDDGDEIEGLVEVKKKLKGRDSWTGV